MVRNKNKVWKADNTLQLVEVLIDIDDFQFMKNFLRDVMTEKELIEISARLEAAKMLAQGKKYADITEKTKLSSRTVARISDWLQNGCDGYKAAIKIVNSHHNHIPPARAE